MRIDETSGTAANGSRSAGPTPAEESVGHQIIGDSGEEIICPMPCAICRAPGDCEDCLDCLQWPRTEDDPPARPITPRGRSVPAMSSRLEAERSRLDLAARVGLTVRRFRGHRQLSQQALAREIGWPPSTLTRAEANATRIPLHKVEALLRHVGYRLVVVPDPAAPPDPLDTGPSHRGDEWPHLREEPVTTWGVPELVARDQRGRRLPPFGQVTWQSPEDRRLYGSRTDDGPEWTWTRPRRHDPRLTPSAHSPRRST